MKEHWTTWHWDRVETPYPIAIPYASIIRWRRGWITLYKHTATDHSVEWRLHLPFNISIGIQL